MNDDLIRRQAVLDYIYNDLGLGDEENGNDVERQMELESSYKYIKSLPPVNPQEPKTGHWINGEYCSECGCDVPAYIIDWKWQKDMNANYCPNCGCRMVDPQESEEV